jgi:hypothetical protein
MGSFGPLVINLGKLKPRKAPANRKERIKVQFSGCGSYELLSELGKY